MKKSISSVVLTSLSLIELSLASSTFRMDIVKNRDVEAAQMLRRDSTITAALTNGKNLYYTNVTVGTPGQRVALQIDTGSSDVWIPSVSNQGCLAGTCIYGSCTSKSYVIQRIPFTYIYYSCLHFPLSIICAKKDFPEQLTPTNLPHILSVQRAISISYTVTELAPLETTSKIP
jgi:hypothetical protein